MELHGRQWTLGLSRGSPLLAFDWSATHRNANLQGSLSKQITECSVHQCYQCQESCHITRSFMKSISSKGRSSGKEAKPHPGTVAKHSRRRNFIIVCREYQNTTSNLNTSVDVEGIDFVSVRLPVHTILLHNKNRSIFMDCSLRSDNGGRGTRLLGSNVLFIPETAMTMKSCLKLGNL